MPKRTSENGIGMTPDRAQVEDSQTVETISDNFGQLGSQIPRKHVWSLGEVFLALCIVVALCELVRWWVG